MGELLFPKPRHKKKRRSHPKSILQNKEEGTCYLCILLEQNYSRRQIREEHHIFYSKCQRRLSEQYGLKVYLCLRHHREGNEAVHNNRKIRRLLEAKGQQAFEALYGRERFLEIFGEDYLWDCESERKEPGGEQRKT